jgi:hypothetical protein
MTARKGKIARLPLYIRDEVSERLRDGQGGTQILLWLNSLQVVKEILKANFNSEPINDENLSAWRSGGFVDWMKDQMEVEKITKIGEFSVRIAQASGGNMSEGLLAILAGKIQTAIETLAAEPELDEKGNPTGYQLGDLVDALAKVRSLELDTHKTRLKEIEVGQKSEVIALEKTKFQRQTCELFLRWFDDKRAREIAEGKGTKDTKVAELIQLWFGDMPDGIGPADVKKPKEGP